jgi:hypothetical protein
VEEGHHPRDLGRGLVLQAALPQLPRDGARIMTKEEAARIIDRFDCTCGVQYDDGTWSDDYCPLGAGGMTDEERALYDEAFKVYFH